MIGALRTLSCGNREIWEHNLRENKSDSRYLGLDCQIIAENLHCYYKLFEFDMPNCKCNKKKKKVFLQCASLKLIIVTLV